VILDALALRRRPFGGFAFIGSLSTLTQFSFRFRALRHQVSLILLFIGATVLLHVPNRNTITHLF
jgi:hypothetical protein